MARYAKPRKLAKTQLRGLRPTPLSVQGLFSPTRIQKMGERILMVLANCSQLSSKEEFLLHQAYLICLFRREKDNHPQRVKLDRLIGWGEAKGRKMGLDSEDFRSLNHWVLDEDVAGRLPVLLEQLEKKRGK